MSARKPIPSNVIRQLLAKSGNRCAFTGCTEKIFTDDNLYIANYCHINAVNQGKRYDAALSEDYINSFENLMVMCYRHHKEVDADENKYTVPVLKEMKQKHENSFTAELTISAELVIDAMEKGMQQLLDILQSINNRFDNVESMLTDLHRGLYKGSQSMDLTEQLQDLKPLKKSGKHNAVLDLLFNYQSKYGETLTEEFKYKIALNIGMTYFDLNDNDNAAKYLTGLKASSYETNFKESNIAIGYMSGNDRDNAVKYARIAATKNINDINAAVVLIECDQITEDELSSEIKGKPEIQLSLAKSFERKNDYKQAVEIYERVLQTIAYEPELAATVKMFLSLALYSSIKQLEHLVLGKIAPSETEIITRSHRLIDEAIAYYAETDLLPSKWFLITNRGIFEKLLGRKDDAEKSFQYSLQIRKSYFTYKHLIILYIPTDKMLKAISEARQMELKDEDKLELLMIEGEFFLASNRFDECLQNIELAKSLVQPGMVSEEYYYTVLFEHLVATRNYDELKKQLILIEQRDSLSFLHIFYSIHVASKENEPVFYNNLCAKAIDMIREGEIPIPNKISLGRFFFAIGDYGHAIEAFLFIVDKDRYQPMAYDLIYSFYKTGRYLEATEWATGYLNSGQATDQLIDGLSTIYADSGRVDEAVAVLRNFLGDHENNFLAVKLCIFECSLCNYEEAGQLLHKLRDTSKFNLEVQFQIALAYKLTGQVAEGDKIAYGIRTAHYHNQDAHHKYIGYVMEVDATSKDEAFPDFVGNDCYVALTAKGKLSREYIICDAPVLPIELNKTEPLAQRLLGKKLNGKIVVDKTTYKINSIMTKTTHAVNESLYLMINRFTGSGYQQFDHSDDKSSEENLQPIFNFMDKQMESANRLKDFYKQRSSTIGALALLFHENVIHSWQRLVSSDGLEIFWQSVVDNTNLLDAGLAENMGVIVDITSFLTMYQNDQLACFDKLKNKKYVSFSTIDIIDNHLQDLDKELVRGGHLSVQKTPNGYERFFISKEMIEKRIEYVKTFKSAILCRCEVLLSPITNNYFQKKKWDEVLGVSFNDTMAIARENKLLLLSEDALFRELCRGEKGIIGFSYFMLLDYLKRKEIISINEWDGSVVKIIKLNYRSVPVTGDVLFASFDSDGFMPGTTMEKAAVSLVDEPRPSVKAMVTADFLKTLYINSQLMDKRDNAAIWIIGKYFRKNTSIISKTILQNEIEKRFKLLPIQADKLKDILDKVQPIS